MSKLQRIIKALNNRDFNSIKKILLDNNDPTLQSKTFNVTDPPTINENIYFDMVNDRGNGRITDGLQSLELISLTFTGRSVDSVLRFDRQKIYVNPINFRQNNSEREIMKVISRSLGFRENDIMITLARVNTELYDVMRTIFKQMHTDVILGIFSKTNYEGFLPLLRRVAKVVQDNKRIF